MTFICQHAYSHLARDAATGTSSEQTPAVQELAAWLDRFLLRNDFSSAEPRELASRSAAACAKLTSTNTRGSASCVATFMQKVDAALSPIDISNVLWAAATGNYALDQQDVSCMMSRLLVPCSAASARNTRDSRRAVGGGYPWPAS